MRHGKKKRNRGFTLLEIVIAMTVLTIGVLGYMVVHYQSVSSRAFAKSMNGVLTAGASNLEELRAVDFDQLTGSGLKYVDRSSGEEVGQQEYDLGTAYSITWQVNTWDAVTTNTNSFLRSLKTVNATIKWKTKGLESSAVLFTFDRGEKTGDLS